jgi:hypothetical protein
MSGLGKRLTALEQIAEEMRLRPFRELAEEHGIPFDRLMELWDEARAETARLRAEGLSDREIVALKATKSGADPDEMWREGEELAARLNNY